MRRSVHVVCPAVALMVSLVGVIQTITLKFTDRLSHSFRSQRWPHSRRGHHQPNTITGSHGTGPAKLGATKLYIYIYKQCFTSLWLLCDSFIRLRRCDVGISAGDIPNVSPHYNTCLGVNRIFHSMCQTSPSVFNWSHHAVATAVTFIRRYV